MLLKGEEFNRMYVGPHYKILNEEREHNGFRYSIGLNTDTVEFAPYDTCQPGGLLFYQYS